MLTKKKPHKKPNMNNKEQNVHWKIKIVKNVNNYWPGIVKYSYFFLPRMVKYLCIFQKLLFLKWQVLLV